MALTPQQQQSVKDSGGYYDPFGNWIDLSGQNTGGGLASSPAAAALASILGLTLGRTAGQSSAAGNIPPQLSQLLDMSAQRAQSQNPLFSAATSGMYQMLPDFAKGGAQLPPSSASGGTGSAMGGLSAPLGLAALAAMSRVPFQSVISALKNMGAGGVAAAGGPAVGSAGWDPFNFGVGGGTGGGADLENFSFYNPTKVQNPANPNAAAFGGAPVAGPDQAAYPDMWRSRVQAY